MIWKKHQLHISLLTLENTEKEEAVVKEVKTQKKGAMTEKSEKLETVSDVDKWFKIQ